jgi:hypothetical protein
MLATSFSTPSVNPDINNPNSDANKYLREKTKDWTDPLSKVEHTWMADTDAIIEKMTLIVEKLNKPISEEKDPTTGKLISSISIGLVALTRARVSSFIIAKFLDDVGKQLSSTSKGSTIASIWSTKLPSPWVPNKSKPEIFSSKDLDGLAGKFIIGLGRCCEAVQARSRGPATPVPH